MPAGLLSVAAAAERLGVSPSRVRQRIEDGSLAAERVGSQWGIHPQALADAPPKRSRPMSRRMAWALIALLAGSDPRVSPAERVRLRKRADQLRDSDDPASLLRSWASSRAERRNYNAATPDLDELRADDRLRLSGLSALDSGVVARSVVEAYVARSDVAGLVDNYFLVQPDDRRGNVILHVIDDKSPDAPTLVDIPWPLLAIDLAEHSGARERARAAETGAREAARVTQSPLVVMPDMDVQQEASWLGLFRLAGRVPDGWTLVGKGERRYLAGALPHARQHPAIDEIPGAADGLEHLILLLGG